MLQYANGFKCAMDQSAEEVIISFLQHTPVFESDGSTQQIKTEEVSTMVMRRSLAEQLLIVLQDVISTDET